jgi:hypothetical protein
VPDLPRRRRRRSRLIGCSLATALACLATPGAALADTSTLTTDAGSAPLATAAQLAPGVVVERCIVVTTATQYTSADLGMFATANGGLADHLTVTVETGSGGSFADCTGFAGRLIYVGTLSGLAGAYDATRPERVGRYNPDTSSVTLRLRFAVQDTNAAQGQTTSASFWWLPVAPLPVPTPAPTTSAPTGTPSPTATSTAPQPSASAPAPVTPTSHPVVRPTPAPPTSGPVTSAPVPVTSLPATAPPPTPSASATPLGPPVGVPLTGNNRSPGAVPPGNDGGDDPPTGLVGQLASGLVTGVTNAAQTISTAAAPALKGAAVSSLMTLPLVVLFLLVQRVIDRRDPKLALAPSYGDPFLGFAERHPTRPAGQQPHRPHSPRPRPRPEPGGDAR